MFGKMNKESFEEAVLKRREQIEGETLLRIDSNPNVTADTAEQIVTAESNVMQETCDVPAEDQVPQVLVESNEDPLADLQDDQIRIDMEDFLIEEYDWEFQIK